MQNPIGNLIICVFFMAVLWPEDVFPVSFSATATAHIVDPIKIKTKRKLKFGNIHPGTVISVIRIDYNNVRSLVSGDAILMPGRYWAARFRVTGTPNAGFTINLPSIIADIPGMKAIKVDNFIDSEGGSSVIGPSGVKYFTVGGDLHIKPETPIGRRTFKLPITVSYN